MASIAEKPRTQPADLVPPARRPWLASAFIVWAVGLGAWSAWLTVTLPHRHLTPNWNIAWGGFDVILAIGLITTGTTAWRGSDWFPTSAVATATLLVVDAWFDILTSHHGAELAQAIAMALIVELPLAALCLVMAWRRNRRVRTLPAAVESPKRTDVAA